MSEAKNRRRTGVIFGNECRPKNWLFGLCRQTNYDIKWKLRVEVGLFSFIIVNLPFRGMNK